jgi:hypothetical protein
MTDRISQQTNSFNLKKFKFVSFLFLSGEILFAFKIREVMSFVFLKKCQ